MKQKLTLSVNEDLVNAAKARRINLSAFVESKLLELVNEDTNQCGCRTFA
jgi:post-segregation antitoxin (ccd killing protein)